jgi:hypothetical protein
MTSIIQALGHLKPYGQPWPFRRKQVKIGIAQQKACEVTDFPREWNYSSGLSESHGELVDMINSKISFEEIAVPKLKQYLGSNSGVIGVIIIQSQSAATGCNDRPNSRSLNWEWRDMSKEGFGRFRQRSRLVDRSNIENGNTWWREGGLGNELLQDEIEYPEQGLSLAAIWGLVDTNPKKLVRKSIIIKEEKMAKVETTFYHYTDR